MLKKKTALTIILMVLSLAIYSNAYEFKIGQVDVLKARIKDELKPDFFGCTIIMAARNDLVFAGNNEDRDHPETIVSFIPASKKYYGKIVFGYNDSPFQGGMNDQGLFIDGNSLPSTGWQPESGKPTFRGIVIMVILGTCATCEDVRNFFEKYNFPVLEKARFPVADRSGASMVVEYGQGGTQFVTSDTWYQIATNFVISNVKDSNYPCSRYRIADKILSKTDKLNLKLIRKTLDETSKSQTVYSNICDLKKGIVYIYNRRNFDEVVVMDLAEELKKGQRRIDLPSMFKSRSDNPELTNSSGKNETEVYLK